MTPNTYHEEISDQDVVSQLERLEKPAMTQTMLEKMVEAIADNLSRKPGYFGRYDDVDGTKVVRLDGDFLLSEIARAALQALREPTEEIMLAVEPDYLSTSCTPSVADGWRKEYRRIFTTAIDAILQEKPEQG